MQKYIITAVLFATYHLFSGDIELSPMESLSPEIQQLIILSAPGKNLEGIRNVKGLFLTNKSWNHLFAVSILDKIAQEEDPNSVQKSVRMLLKGNQKACIALSRQAAHSNNVIAQLYLSAAYFGMNRSQDAEKDFNGINEKDLESYIFAHEAPELLKEMLMYANENTEKHEEQVFEKQSKKLIKESCRKGNIYAHLVRTLDREPCSEEPSGFEKACKLKPLMAQSQFPELLYYYGESVCDFAVSFYYYNSGTTTFPYTLEGLKYMDKSGFLKVYFFEEEKKDGLIITDNFQDYCNNLVQRKPYYYDKYGMRFIGRRTVVAPSKEHWNTFKREKFDTVPATQKTVFDLFSRHDMEKIVELKTKYNLSVGSKVSHGLKSLSIYSENSNKVEKIGTIRITDIESGVTSDITLPDQYKELVPTIAFLKDAFGCSRDGDAVFSIMHDLKHYLKIYKTIPQVINQS